MNSIKPIRLPQSYSELLEWVACIWAATLCFPSLQWTFYVVFLLFVWGRITKRISSSFSFKSHWSLYILFIYILWMVSSVLWTENYRSFFHGIEKLIPLLLFALIGFTKNLDKLIDQKTVLRFFFFGLFIAMFLMIINMVVDFYGNDFIARVKLDGIGNVNLFHNLQHSTYIGISFVIASGVLLFQKNPNYVLVSLLMIFGITSGARSIQLLLILEFIVFIIKQFPKVGKVKYLLPFLLVILLVIAFNNNSIQKFKYSIQEGLKIEKAESRINIWTSSIDIISQSPFVGIGLGDTDAERLARYKTNKHTREYAKNFNSHNQFLETTLASGLVGVGLLLTFLISFFFKKRQLLPSIIGLTFLFSMLFESVLARNIGVFPFVFWSFLVLISRNKKTISFYDDKLNFVSYLFTLILVIVLISVFFLKQTPEDPRTNMTNFSQIVKYKDLPYNEQLPSGTDGAMLIYSDIMKGNDKYFISLKHKQNDLSDNELTAIDFSAWFYLPKQEGLYYCQMIATDGFTKLTSRTNRSQAGHWQKVAINDTLKLKQTLFKTTAILNLEEANPNDYLYIALPTIKTTAIIPQ